MLYNLLMRVLHLIFGSSNSCGEDAITKPVILATFLLAIATLIIAL